MQLCVASQMHKFIALLSAGTRSDRMESMLGHTDIHMALDNK